MSTDRESIRREAYTKALKFKNTGMDAEAIFARLEKQGVPVDIAVEVAQNVTMKMKQDKEKIPGSVNSLSIWRTWINALFK